MLSILIEGAQLEGSGIQMSAGSAESLKPLFKMHSFHPELTLKRQKTCHYYRIEEKMRKFGENDDISNV